MKAELDFTFFEKGYKYGEYKYRNHSYTVCFNAFWAMATLAEQHRREQELIDIEIEKQEKAKLKAKPNERAESCEDGFALFWESVGGE